MSYHLFLFFSDEASPPLSEPLEGALVAKPLVPARDALEGQAPEVPRAVAAAVAQQQLAGPAALRADVGRAAAVRDAEIKRVAAFPPAAAAGGGHVTVCVQEGKDGCKSVAKKSRD